MNFKLMAEHTRYLKENAKGVDGMCKIMEEMRTEALEEGIRKVVLRMLESGKYSVEEISNVSGLTPDEVEKLKTERTTGA